MDDDVWALTVFDDGSGPALIVAGNFLNAGSVAASRIAKWDGSSWTALGAGLDGFVFALVVFDDGNGPALIAGGGIPWNGRINSSLGRQVGRAELDNAGQ